MKVVTKDNVQSHREKQKKQNEANYRLARQQYIDKLKSSTKFQNYVVKEIIVKAIEELNDLSKIPAAGFKDKQELGELVLANQVAVKKLNKVLQELLS